MAQHSETSYFDLSSVIQNIATEPMAYGGFSDIFLGDIIDSHGSRKAVFKVLRTCSYHIDDFSRAKKRLNREVAVISKLKHPNIAEFFGISFHLNHRPSIVMAWYSHGDAPTYLNNRPRSERLRVVKGLVEALCYLHSRRPAIVHGDIKGVNVLINDSREGVLSDFGLSRNFEDTVGPSGNTTSGVGMAGTVRWMAPELLQGDPEPLSDCGPTLASDIWAFGCTFYEMLTGNIPYSFRKHAWLVIASIVRGEHPYSREVESYKTWEVVRECWESVPKHRPTIFELKNKLSISWD